MSPFAVDGLALNKCGKDKIEFTERQILSQNCEFFQVIRRIADAAKNYGKRFTFWF
jgi:hypothetical protein